MGGRIIAFFCKTFYTVSKKDSKKLKYLFIGIDNSTSNSQLCSIKLNFMANKETSKEDQIQKLNEYLQLQKRIIQALSMSSDSGMTRIYSAIKTSK